MIVEKKCSRQWEWQKKRHEAGLCVICGKGPLKTSWHCKDHARAAAINNDLRNKMLKLDKNVLDGPES